MIIEREIKKNMKIDMSKGRLWTVRIMSGIVILFMLMDGIRKIVEPATVVQDTLALGFTQRHMAVMGVLGLFSTLLYAIPRTSFLGALLLTGYLGGAVAAQIRVDAPLFSNILFPGQSGYGMRDYANFFHLRFDSVENRRSLTC